LTSERELDKIMLTLQGEGVPAPKVRASYEFLEEPQLLERGIETPIPCLGEHNEKVLCGLLGIKKEE
jgi:hypothetical protein